MSTEPLRGPSSHASTAPPAPDTESRSIAGRDEPTAVVPELTPAPSPEETRRSRRRRVRARKVTRVIRRVEPWSVLKVAAVLYVCLWLVLTVAGVILWQVARATGTLDNLEDFLATALADSSFTIDGRRVLWSSLTAGGVMIFAGTALTVLLAVLFNLVSELTGGLRVAVVELETAVPVDEDVG